MKKISALALLATCAAAANAQSNVTLFGIVDVGVRHVKNGDNSVSSVSSNGLSTSRLGVRGVEDLGDGLKAGFWLETGLNPDTGTTSDSSRFWNRRATVSLSGRFGELRLGRDFTPTYTGFSAFDAFGTNGVAAADKFVSRFGTTADTLTRADNEVSYFLPEGLGGVYGQVSAAAGEGVSGKKYGGGRVGYAAGPLDVSLAYGQTEVTPNAAGDDKFESGTLGASYDLRVVKLTGYVSRMEFSNQKLDVANIGALVPVGQGTVRVSYIKAEFKGPGIDNDEADQIALGYVYNLSKRTALYATAARVNNKGNAAFIVDGNPGLPSPNPARDSTGYEVGMTHRF
jgi:predicted porin